MTDPSTPPSQDRIAKVIARAGLCSRREAEAWIAEGRVAVNGVTLVTPAVTVGPRDTVTVDGHELPTKERTRLWLYHKPRGLVTTTRDPEGRPTVFERLPTDLPRVISVGRLDINTEGLLLLTNDGGLARVLELPATGWLRKYRVRAHGQVTQADLDKLKDGIAVDGILYGAIEATLDQVQGTNVWITMGLREGKNREVKNVLTALGLQVTRLIRISFGPFQLGELSLGTVTEVPGRTLRDQLGRKLAAEANADFTAPITHQTGRSEPQAGSAQTAGRGSRRDDAGTRPRREGRPMTSDKRRARSRADERTGPSDRPRHGRPDREERPARFEAREGGPEGRRPPRGGGTYAPGDRPRRDEGTDGRGERKDRKGGFSGRGEDARGDRPVRGRRPEDSPGGKGAGRPPRRGGDSPARSTGDRAGPRPERSDRPGQEAGSAGAAKRSGPRTGGDERPRGRPGGKPGAGAPAGKKPSRGNGRPPSGGQRPSGPGKGPRR
ncbi:pseudouridine synthase [Amorphus orientalis]|nr:pseudouridine synthase [Amorphus orientalis]